MNILIVGCNMPAVILAKMLDEDYDISIVVEKKQNLEYIEDFDIFTVVGEAIDEDVLISAGIKESDVVVVMTGNDNTNLMVSQMALNVFKVNNVITTIVDRRKLIFKDTGINIICPTKNVVDNICCLIFDEREKEYLSIGKTSLILKYIKPNEKYIGKSISSFIPEKDYFIYGILKSDNNFYIYLNNNDNKNIMIEKDDKIVLNKVMN